MKRITYAIRDEKVHITVNIKRPRSGWKPSIHGRCFIIASTAGVITLKNGMKLSLCVFSPREINRS